MCNPFEIFKFNPGSRRGFSKRHKQPSTQHTFNMSAHLVVNISQTFFSSSLFFILRGAFYGIKIYFSFRTFRAERVLGMFIHFHRKCVWYDVVHGGACKYVLKNHSQVGYVEAYKTTTAFFHLVWIQKTKLIFLKRLQNNVWLRKSLTSTLVVA